MKFIGHLLVGDPIYGRNKGIKMNGQALHAAVLGFVHPATGEYMEFLWAPLPQDMEDVLALTAQPLTLQESTNSSDNLSMA